MSDALVAGVDSSTQSTKVLVCDAETGAVVREGRAAHPDGVECDPRAWWRALEQASGGLFDGVRTLAVAGQQHGLVTVDGSGEPVRPALLWNDTRSAAASAALIEELGGPEAWAAAVGSVPVAAFTVTKLRWLAEQEPGNARRVAAAMLPHDWLTWRLGGAAGGPTTDRGDASGTGYYTPWPAGYRDDLVRLAFGRALDLPAVAEPAQAVGETANGIVLAPGTGDNMGAALGLGLAEGDVAVSVGTSGTVFTVSSAPTADSSGAVAGFADATGGYLPLVCTLNAARVLSAVGGILRCTADEFDALALSADPGAGGVTLLPYLDGERTPNRPGATGVFGGLTTTNATAENLARAAVEGMLCGLADGMSALRAHGVRPRRVLLIGGGARSRAVRKIAPAIFGCPVLVPPPAEYVALGAARQASWVMSGEPHPPAWPLGETMTRAAEPDEATLARYTALRDATAS